MTDFHRLLLDLRRMGIGSKAVVRWGEKHGRMFAQNTINSIAYRHATRVRDDIAQTIRELHNLFCT
jgi:hypothetical protein